MHSSARVAAMLSAAESFDLRAIVPQAWKNGGGLTREIAVGPRGADMDNFDWRISVAEITQDAPFSLFPGVDRCIVLLAGGGLHLRSEGGNGPVDHRLDRVHLPFHFSGDERLESTLLAGASCDFNVMTRRGRVRSEVRSLDAATTLRFDGAALLLCCAGHWRSDALGAALLAPQQGLLWRELVRDGPAAVQVEPADGAVPSRLLFVRLCHDRAP